jgi:hypothetical protein
MLKDEHIKTTHYLTMTVLLKTIIFQYTLQFCQQSSSTFQHNKYLHPAEVSLFPLQPLAQGILHCLIMQGMVPLQAVLQKTKQGKK